MRLVAKLVTVAAVPALALSLLFFPIADNVSADYQPASGWAKYTGDLDLDGEILVSDAWVIYDAGTFRMWYTRLRLDETYADIADRITNLGGPAIANAILTKNLDGLLTLLAGLDATAVIALLNSATTVIGYATSTNGIDWTIENREVLASGSSLHNGVGTPCVIKDGTTYKMWYTRFEVDWEAGLAAILTGLAGDTAARQTAIQTFLNQTRSVIGYATSPDCITWTPNTPDDQIFPDTDGTILSSIGAPCVIKEGDTDYKMWYTGINTDLTLADIADVLTNTGSFDMDALIGLLDGFASVIGYATSVDGITWTEVNNNVLSGSGPLWESIGDPCVVKATSTYEMWYTRGTTDLTTAIALDDLLNAIKALNLSGLWGVLDDSGIEAFLDEYINNRDLTDINNLISNTSSVIGYATSDDGAVWTVQEESDLTGSSTNLWSSVGAPCVIGDGIYYTMWFTKGIGTLDLQSLLDLIFGGNCSIGRATSPPSGGGGGGYIPPPPGVTSVIGKVDEDGYFTEKVVAPSADGLAWVTIAEGIQGLDRFGYPINRITIVEMEDPPDPPTDHSVVGLVYDFGPDGSTFDPPITLTITYDPELIPDGVAEEDLTIAVWDKDTETWVKLPSVVDTENKTITAETDGFTGFAILAANAPASFSVLFLSITPGQIDIGQSVQATVTVVNTGDIAGTYQVELLINDAVEDVREITLAGNGRITFSFEITKSVPGRYTVSIAGLTGSFTVKEAEVIEPEEPEPEPEADIVTSRLWVTPPSAKVGDIVTVSALIINRGDGEGSYDVIVYVDRKVLESRTVTLAANSEQTETFTYIPDTTGIHTVEIDELDAILAVLKGVEEPEDLEELAALNWWLIGGITGGCAVITAIVAVFLLRRRFA